MSLSDLARRIRENISRSKSLTNGVSPPLTGQDALDFETWMIEARSDSDDALDDTFFAGITPALAGQPVGATLMGWLLDMADEALAIVQLPAPTSQQKQTAADGYYTIAGKVEDAIANWT